MVDDNNYQPNRDCRCTRCLSHGLMGPVVLITLGILFLLSEFHLAGFGRTWPVLLIVIGAVKVLGSTADSSGHVHCSAPPAAGGPPPQAASAPNSEHEQVPHV